MARLIVRWHLRRIARDLAALEHYVRQHGAGRTEQELVEVDGLASEIATSAASVAALTREEMGSPRAPGFISFVRRAFGGVSVRDAGPLRGPRVRIASGGGAKVKR